MVLEDTYGEARSLLKQGFCLMRLEDLKLQLNDSDPKGTIKEVLSSLSKPYWLLSYGVAYRGFTSFLRNII